MMRLRTSRSHCRLRINLLNRLKQRSSQGAKRDASARQVMPQSDPEYAFRFFAIEHSQHLLRQSAQFDPRLHRGIGDLQSIKLEWIYSVDCLHKYLCLSKPQPEKGLKSGVLTTPTSEFLKKLRSRRPLFTKASRCLHKLKKCFVLPELRRNCGSTSFGNLALVLDRAESPSPEDCRRGQPRLSPCSPLLSADIAHKTQFHTPLLLSVYCKNGSWCPWMEDAGAPHG